jgi:hypothetical protein
MRGSHAAAGRSQLVGESLDGHQVLEALLDRPLQVLANQGPVDVALEGVDDRVE